MTCTRAPFLASLLAAAAALGGCGNSGADDDEVGAINELRGTWTTGCLPERAASGAVERYSIATVAFASTNVTAGTSLHPATDSTCADATATVVNKVISTFTGGKLVGEPAGAKTFDLTPGHVEITLLTDTGVATANQTQVCGFSDWQKGTAKDVTTAVCEDDGRPGNAVYYDVYKVEGGKLFFGRPDDASNGHTPSSRPRALDTATPYTREA